MPVETSRDVGDDLGIGVDLPHLLGLSVEVASLLGGADPAVANHSRSCSTVQVSVHVVETLAAGVAVVGDFAFSGIASQSLRV